MHVEPYKIETPVLFTGQGNEDFVVIFILIIFIV